VAGSLSPDLPEAERRRRPELTAPYVAPETPLEADLIQAWSEALQMDGVGVHDNFFELGGDSLQATVLLNRLQDHLGEAIPGHALFQVQSVHELVNYLREHCPGAVRRHYPDELLAFGESGHFSEIVPPEALARGADVRGATPSFSIPRLARDEEADDLLSRLDDLEIDEVEKLLGRSKTSGEVIHE
jgi:acyl carrier protein